MKPTTLDSGIRRITAALAGLFLLTNLALAQAVTNPTGSIEGRVKNATNDTYITNARITVEGTNLQVFTDAGGHYRLDNVPAGTAKVHVFYTGLAEQVLPVTVAGGVTATQDFDVSTSAQAPKAGEVVTLDAFTVASQREVDAAAIAINEQRFAGNIKNVVNTDAFGDIAEGNVGDFVKFLPGVNIDYVSPDARTISVRGVAPNYTSLTLNGNPIASASSSGESRVVELEQISLNNSARIEITKSRSPDQPANALGGTVNLVARSAFEYSKPKLNYRAFFSINGDEAHWDKTRGPTNESSRKIKPGFDLLYVNPVTKNFGFTVSLLESNIFYPQHRTQPNYSPNMGSGPGATPDHPYLRQYQVQDGPKNNQRESIGLTADWRLAPRDVLTFGFQWSYYNAFFGNRPVTYTVGGNIPNPPAVGIPPREWDQVNGTYVHGAFGQGTVNLATSFRHKYGFTYQPDISWKHTGSVWKLDANAAFSNATNHYHDYQDDHWENVQINLRGNPASNAAGAATVNFDALDQGAYLWPTISVYNNTGTTRLNLADPANYNVASAATNPADSVDQFQTIRANAARDLNMQVPVTLKAGFQFTQQRRDIRKDNPGTFTFIGPDHVANSADDKLSLYDLVDPQYSTQPYLFGMPQVPVPDPYRFWSLYKQHPDYFQTPSQATYIQNVSNTSKLFKERVSAAYLQADARMMENRLRIVAGIRFERTDIDGQGPTNDPNAAKGITDPTAAAAARFGIRTNIMKDHYAAGYPSIDIAYNIKPDLLVRFAYGRSIGRPEINQIIPGATLPDSTASSGTITVNNVALEPTQTNAYDVSLEYYFAKTAVVSIGGFYKDFSNFTGVVNQPATLELLQQLGVPEPEQYVEPQDNFTVSTRLNVGDAKLSGIEFNYKQALDFRWLPEWAMNKFTVYANGQKMHLEGSTLADFSNFIRETANMGLTYSPRKLTAQINVNFRGRQRLAAQTFNPAAPGAYEYWKPRTYIDLNFEYRFKPEVAFFANARNVTNVAQDIQRYAPNVTPSWSRTYRREEFGVQYTVGVKGTF